MQAPNISKYKITTVSILRQKAEVLTRYKVMQRDEEGLFQPG